MSEDADDDDLEQTEEELEFGLDQRSQIFLTMRQQNLILLKIASDVAGLSKGHPPLRPEETRKALKVMWDLYSEIYSWVDPEESEEDEEGEEEE